MPQQDTGFVEAVSHDSPNKYVLKLFVTGASPNSVRAIVNIKTICDEFLPGNYILEIIDVHQLPLIAQQEQLIALPMLIKLSPSPVKKLIGDMSDREKVVEALRLNKK